MNVTIEVCRGADNSENGFLHVELDGFKVCQIDRRQDPELVFDFCRPVKQAELDAVLDALREFRAAP